MQLFGTCHVQSTRSQFESVVLVVKEFSFMGLKGYSTYGEAATSSRV